MNKSFSPFELLSKCIQLIGPQRSQLPWVFLASLVVSLVDTASVGLVGPFVASVVAPEIVREKAWFQWLVAVTRTTDFDTVTVMALLLIGVFFVKSLISTLVLKAIFGFCSRLDRRLRNDLLDRYYSMDLASLTESSSAKFVQAVHGYSSQFSYGLVGTQLRSLTELLIAGSILGYLFYLNAAALSLLLILVGGLIFAYDKMLKKKIHGFGQEAEELGETLISAVHHVSGGLREIRVYGVGERLLERAKAAAERFSILTARYLWIQSVPKYLIEFCLMTAICALVLQMQHKHLPKEEMFSLMGVFGVAVMRLTPAANYVLSALSQLRFSHFVVERLITDLKINEPAPVVSKAESENKKSVKEIESLKLSDISFRYAPDLPNVFSGVNIQIMKGDSIGLVGPSGGGKTTLAEIILGLWKPTSGSLLINGELSSHFDAGELLSHFAYIPQQLFLISGTLAENISLLDPADDSNARAAVAAESAQLESYIAGLKHGLETPCGENGALLSGGQRQRVALARAFYHKRSILVMDEATSALDYATEREVIQEVKALKGKVTLIVIAHRLETVLDCDRIFRIANGQVSEISRESLINEIS